MTQLNEIQIEEGFCCRNECCGGGSWCCAHADEGHRCSGDDESRTQYLSMPNPPGATRMEIIAAKLHCDDKELEEIFGRIHTAKAEITKDKLAGREDVLDEMLDNLKGV